MTLPGVVSAATLLRTSPQFIDDPPALSLPGMKMCVGVKAAPPMNPWQASLAWLLGEDSSRGSGEVKPVSETLNEQKPAGAE